MNHVTLVGRLTRDPELRYTASGVAVASFGLAVDRPFANADGEREADFLEIIAWRKLAETVSGHLQKGRLVGIAGRVQTRTYETQEGQKRKVYEVVASEVRFLDSPKEKKPAAQEPAPSDADAPPAEAETEEVPF